MSVFLYLDKRLERYNQREKLSEGRDSMKTFITYNKEKHIYPVVISLPHSGTWIPEEMRSSLRKDVVLANTDWFLPELYNFLVAMGCTMIENRGNRYVADPNRESQIKGMNYQEAVIYQQNTFGKALYTKKLTSDIITERLENYYWPYHQALQRLIDAKKSRFGKVYLIDLHSFAEYPNDARTTPADFVIGNQMDQTSSAKLRKLLTVFLKEAGYSVSNNHPFRGGFITRHFSELSGIEALQLEIRYNQYIEKRSFGEEVLTKYDSELFSKAQEHLAMVFRKLFTELSIEK